MTISPKLLIDEWPPEEAARRALTCVRFLSVHQFLTDAEAGRAHEKILTWIGKKAPDLFADDKMRSRYESRAASGVSISRLTKGDFFQFRKPTRDETGAIFEVIDPVTCRYRYAGRFQHGVPTWTVDATETLQDAKHKRVRKIDRVRLPMVAVP